MRNRVAKALRRKVFQARGSRRNYRMVKRAWHLFPRRKRNPILRGYWIDRRRVLAELKEEMAS